MSVLSACAGEVGVIDETLRTNIYDTEWKQSTHSN